MKPNEENKEEIKYENKKKRMKNNERKSGEFYINITLFDKLVDVYFGGEGR